MSKTRRISPQKDVALARIAPPKDDIERPRQAVKKWARGKATLGELKGYTADELYAISQHGYTLFLNGKLGDARVVFEGLVALEPRNDYFYRALGVIYYSQGDPDRALRQFTHAITVAPRTANGYVNRAEVHIAKRDFESARSDLSRAIQVGWSQNEPIVRKASALRDALPRTGRRRSPP